MFESNCVLTSSDSQRLSVEQSVSSEPFETEQTIKNDNQLHIRFRNITKTFGSINANNDVSCDIQSGGIHAFLGENGAGKSTLMKILAGYYQPNRGSIYINDAPIILKSPAEARRIGIGMVHQQFTLVPSLTVLENVLLGHPSTPMILNHKQQALAVKAKAIQYGIDLDIHLPISRLNMAQCQKVEILKLLWRDARILILDEPTSQLAPFEAEEILQTMTNLAASGRIVILITHHIEELRKFASVITVLRQGRMVANFQAKTVQAEELASLMIGEKYSEAMSVTTHTKTSNADVNRLMLKGVSLRSSSKNRVLHSIDLHIRAGEVHGIAGITGSGQDELAAILAGHLIPDTGQLFLDGVRADWAQLQNPHNSFAYVPADAKKGSIANLTLLENILLRGIHRKEFLAGPFIRKERVAQMAKERLTAFDVRPGHISVLGGSLSGGNLQRLILAREFDKPTSLMVAVNPAAGLDLAMSLRIRRELRQYVAEERSVLLISPDLDELLKTCDRISVMFAGRIVGTEYVSNLDSQSLGLLLGGNSLATAAEVLPSLTNYNSDRPIEIGQDMPV
jgi:general nucleoside transport system ATP-binding protein